MKIGKKRFVLLPAYLLSISILVTSLQAEPLNRDGVMRYITEQQNYMTKPWLTSKKDLDDLFKHTFQLNIKRSVPSDSNYQYEETNQGTKFDCFKQYGPRKCKQFYKLFMQTLY